MNLFVKKSIDGLLKEANETDSNSLKKTLGPGKLVALGVGAIIGAGLFSITGGVAAEMAGPAITISFLIAAIGCCFAGLCYAEFASMIPVAGSAYTYSYATMGEFIAWIIGWDLVLEYAVAAATVSISWSRYVIKFFDGFGIHLPQSLVACPWEGGIVNLPAVFIVVLMSLLLIKGTEGSTRFNNIIVSLKIGVVLIFIFLGWKYINLENYTPYIPENTGTFGAYGWTGIIRAAAVVFFAFIGFDAVSTAAQEAKNPKRDMPIGILISLLICTVLYFLFAHVMTGVANYTEFKGHDGIAPVAIAIEHMGHAGADGLIHPDYPWLNRAIILAILAGYSSVIMVLLMGQTRVFYSMSKDGLLPKFFSHIHPKFRTPAKSNLLFLLLVSLFAAFIPSRVAGEMTSIGTLLAFILVCIGIIVLRKKMPNAPRAFKTPLVPFVPICGVLTCLFMMVFLPADTWIRLILWMLIGLDIYTAYGMKNSKIGSIYKEERPGQNVLNITVIVLSVVLILAGFWHQVTAGWESSKFLLFSALSFSVVHMFIFGMRLLKKDFILNPAFGKMRLFYQKVVNREQVTGKSDRE
ncbi:amino acid permease [Bacteroides sedimenti]|uniref:Amino acid permease n=1 Tax=Bacteroides sedimenti TaxID=2136147 RepID=A0ABM8ILE7_9BACE